VIVVIAALNTARSFCTQARMFAQHHQLPADSITLPKCLSLVETFIYKALAERMEWIDHERNRIAYQDHNLPEGWATVSNNDPLIHCKLLNPELEELKSLTRLFEWYQDEPHNYHELSEYLYTELVDDLWLLVQDQVHLALPERSWHIWRVKQLGKDMYLEQDVDYRVRDWECSHGVKERMGVNKNMWEDKRDAPDREDVRDTPTRSAAPYSYAAQFATKELRASTIDGLFKPNSVLQIAPLPTHRDRQQDYIDPAMVDQLSNELSALKAAYRQTPEQRAGKRLQDLLDYRAGKPAAIMTDREQRRLPNGNWVPLVEYTGPERDAHDQAFVSSLQELADRRQRIANAKIAATMDQVRKGPLPGYSSAATEYFANILDPKNLFNLS